MVEGTLICSTKANFISMGMDFEPLQIKIEATHDKSSATPYAYHVEVSHLHTVVINHDFTCNEPWGFMQDMITELYPTIDSEQIPEILEKFNGKVTLEFAHGISTCTDSYGKVSHLCIEDNFLPVVEANEEDLKLRVLFMLVVEEGLADKLQIPDDESDRSFALGNAIRWIVDSFTISLDSVISAVNTIFSSQSSIEEQNQRAVQLLKGHYFYARISYKYLFSNIRLIYEKIQAQGSHKRFVEQTNDFLNLIKYFSESFDNLTSKSCIFDFLFKAKQDLSNVASFIDNIVDILSEEDIAVPLYDLLKIELREVIKMFDNFKKENSLRAHNGMFWRGFYGFNSIFQFALDKVVNDMGVASCAIEIKTGKVIWSTKEEMPEEYLLYVRHKKCLVFTPMMFFVSPISNKGIRSDPEPSKEILLNSSEDSPDSLELPVFYKDRGYFLMNLPESSGSRTTNNKWIHEIDTAPLKRNQPPKIRPMMFAGEELGSIKRIVATDSRLAFEVRKDNEVRIGLVEFKMVNDERRPFRCDYFSQELTRKFATGLEHEESHSDIDSIDEANNEFEEQMPRSRHRVCFIRNLQWVGSHLVLYLTWRNKMCTISHIISMFNWRRPELQLTSNKTFNGENEIFSGSSIWVNSKYLPMLLLLTREIGYKVYAFKNGQIHTLPSVRIKNFSLLNSKLVEGELSEFQGTYHDRSRKIVFSGYEGINESPVILTTKISI